VSRLEAFLDRTLVDPGAPAGRPWTPFDLVFETRALPRPSTRRVTVRSKFVPAGWCAHAGLT